MSGNPLRPEDFLELVRRARRGRLKLYIGFAAGVGKTYRMLEEAHALRRRGIDIVLGLVEPHGREDTARLIEGLEIIPHRRLQYRGVTVDEMDLDLILARRPDAVIVDEIAHTNAPGSRNRKRYQDVLEILDHGIPVIGAFNIQHLESLIGLVERMTGVVVRETVPDSFLRLADQVVNLDLAVEDLLERLRSGKIYTVDKVPWALEHLFKDANLGTLRELALRQVAESIETAPALREARGPGHRTAAHRRVMACLSSNPPRASALLVRASRLAGRLNTDWFAVFVETPGEAPHRIDAETQRHLHANLDKARELGAEIVRLRSVNPTAAIIDFARSHNVGDILIGHSRRSWWRQLAGRSIPLRLVREAEGFDLHIISFDDGDEKA